MCSKGLVGRIYPITRLESFLEACGGIVERLNEKLTGYTAPKSCYTISIKRPGKCWKHSPDLPNHRVSGDQATQYFSTFRAPVDSIHTGLFVFYKGPTRKEAGGMPTITFYPGLSWEAIPEAQTVPVVRVDVLRERLAKLRAEWEQAAQEEGVSLADMRASVEMMLNDFATILEGK